MKKIAIMTLLLASRAYSHEVSAETEFFKNEIKKTPLTSNLLHWCSLAGLTTEDQCKAEMYNEKGEINQLRLEAAAKCVKRAGLENYSMLNAFTAKYLGMKDSIFVSHIDKRTGERHLAPMKDPSNPTATLHYYNYTASDRYNAGMISARTAVEDLKLRALDGSSTSVKIGGEASVNVGIDAKVWNAETQTKLATEKTKTTTGLTREETEAAWKKGYEFGYLNPSMFPNIKPSGYCEVGGMCTSLDGDYKERDRDAAEMRMLNNPKDGAVAEIKPEAKPESAPRPDPRSAEEIFFSPLTPSTATGGIKTEEKKPEVKPEDKPKDDKAKGKDSTPTHENQLFDKWKECISFEENELLKDVGSKEKDPEVKSKEELKLEAEEQLKNGFCDEKILGTDFCAKWAREIATKKATSKEEDEEAKRQAFEEFQKTGICDRSLLGEVFCRAAENALSSNPVIKEELVEIDGQPSVTPENKPEEHISVDGAPANGDDNRNPMD